MPETRVTIVVVPRERFSAAPMSLESIYENTLEPFELVYVDGGAPEPVRSYLAGESERRGFRLVRTDHYLSPNRARNLGFAEVKTPYVAFVDNDVVVTPGWLGALLACAEETGAAVVGPLTCQGEPVHEIVHCAGGESGVREGLDQGVATRHLIETIHLQGKRVAEVRDSLVRRQTGLAEFHCMLVRSEALRAVGPLDEQLLNTKEHVDLCMAVMASGRTVYFEPRSLVTYLLPLRTQFSDIGYYMLRWSDDWELTSLRRLREKWNLTEDEYFRRKYKGLGWRRRLALVRPLVKFLTFGSGNRYLEAALMPVEKVVNRMVSGRYARQYPHLVFRK